MTQPSPTIDSADAQALIEYLRDRNVACPLCGYNLRALTSSRCPECGRELRLSVGLLEPRQGAWLMTQIALTAAAGIGLLVSIAVMVHGWSRTMGRGWLLSVCAIYWIVAIPLAGANILIRRRYLRGNMRAQWIVAIVATAVTAISIFSFIADD